MGIFDRAGKPPDAGATGLARVGPLERLAALGDALSRANTLDALREVVWRHLPRLVHEREIWLYLRNAEQWEELAGATCRARDVVRSTLAQPDAVDLSAPGDLAGSLYFPLKSANRVVGAFGIVDGRSLDHETRQVLDTAVPLMAIAIAKVQLAADRQTSAVRDTLTGCYTRVHTLELLDAELRRAARSHAQLAIVLLDVDHLTDINAQHGSIAGDAALAAIGSRLTQTLRRSDHRGRSGDDEFLVILPDTPPHAALLVAESIRREMQALAVPAAGAPVPLSVSVGVAHALNADLEIAPLLMRASAALDRAKRSGRNCVRVDEATCDSAETAVLEAMPAMGSLPS